MNQFTFATQTENSNNCLMRPVFFIFWLMKQISIRFWFNPILVSGKHNIPPSGPVVIIGNHSNAFLDPSLAGIVIRRGVHFLTRGDVFKGKLLSAFFHSLHMLPIFRRRDGIQNLKKNDATFESCWKLLKLGKIVLIYPEGDCVLENHLRPFRPGLNKLIFEAYHHYPEIDEIPIIPCGITYTEFHKWNSPVYVSFGEAILTKQFVDEYAKNENKNFDHVLTEAHKKLSQQILDIPRDPIARIEIQKWLRAYRNQKFGGFLHRLGFFNQSQSKLEFEQNIAYAYLEDATPYPGSISQVKALAETNNIVATNFIKAISSNSETKPLSVLGNGILSFIRVFFFPINAILHIIGTAVANKIVKEPEFWASVRYGVAFILGWLMILIGGIVVLITTVI